MLLATNTPVGGLTGVPPDFEAKRQAVNTWIREQSPADAVVDFDAAVRDPADPSRIAPYFDGSDHLHLNLAGYVALGNAVPLELLLDPAVPVAATHPKGQRGMPSQPVSFQPPCGLPTTTMWPMFGSGMFSYNEMSGFVTFIYTQAMIAPECENATGFRSPLS